MTVVSLSTSTNAALLPPPTLAVTAAQRRVTSHGVVPDVTAINYSLPRLATSATTDHHASANTTGNGIPPSKRLRLEADDYDDAGGHFESRDPVSVRGICIVRESTESAQGAEPKNVQIYAVKLTCSRLFHDQKASAAVGGSDPVSAGGVTALPDPIVDG